MGSGCGEAIAHGSGVYDCWRPCGWRSHSSSSASCGCEHCRTSAAGGLLTLCSAQSLLFPSLGDNIAHRNTLIARRRGRKGLAGKKQAQRFIHPATSFLSDSQALSTLSKGQVGVVSGFSVAFTMLFPAFFPPILPIITVPARC